jgi:hypothetical protein
MVTADPDPDSLLQTPLGTFPGPSNITTTTTSSDSGEQGTVEREQSSNDDDQLLSTVSSNPTIAPPLAPPLVETMQEAFIKMMADQGFVEKLRAITNPGTVSDPGGSNIHPLFETTRNRGLLDQSSINLSSFAQTPQRRNDSGFAPTREIPLVFTGMTPNVQPRSLDSDIMLQGSLNREMRKDLKGKDLATFIEKATTPLGVKFDLPLSSQSDPAISASILLDSTYTFVSKVDHLLLRIKNFCMEDVFMIVETIKVPRQTGAGQEDVVVDTNVEPVELFTNYSRLTIEKVKASCQAYYQYGDQIAIDNLMWTQNLILRSCTEALYNTLNARLSILPIYHRGGPTAFMLLAELMISNTDKTSNNILNKLQYIKLANYGENVEQLAAVLHANIQRLEACNKLPPNINYTLIRIFQSSSVYAFRTHFTTLESMNDPRVQDHHKILHEAVTRYRTLKDDDLWNPSVTTKQQSLFHVSANQLTVLQAGSRLPTTPGKLQTHDKMGRPINRVPPASGEPTTHLTSDGRTEDWCNICGRWGNHHDNGHDEFKARFDRWAQQKKASKPAAQGSANVASKETAAKGFVNVAGNENQPASATINYDEQASLVTAVAGSNTTSSNEERLRVPKFPTTNFSLGHF